MASTFVRIATILTTILSALGAERMVTVLAASILLSILKGTALSRKDTPIVHNAVMDSPQVARGRTQMAWFLIPI